ncbi:HNH endonuclease signature motif containing protein [Terriglobus roseus]|uniref:HNH endonuclease n=1 Tax=Terriglobus roseus TaxID=392734 RepID=A0A1H4J3U3_9BACT|nr:HNH endonuclease signature motif containing protein [Terriglobus roseus]SEB40923.1 HNH endonuclease [Terriglobus roseus]
METNKIEQLINSINISRETGCWVWQKGKSRNGYGLVTDKAGTTFLAHRYAYEIFRGPIPEGAYLLHSPSCVSKACINPSHLRCGDQKENMADRRAAGRYDNQPARGKALTIAERKAIFRALDGGQTAYSIAQSGVLGRRVSEPQISYLKKHRAAIEARDAKRKRKTVISILAPLQQALAESVDELCSLANAA